ncbi:hypothetical protein BOTU111922_02865 [Bordetella tumulicola]
MILQDGPDTEGYRPDCNADQNSAFTCKNYYDY